MSEQEFEFQELIGDDWMTAQGIDYLEPIIFEELNDAVKYTRYHHCPECRARLIVTAADGIDAHEVVCPNGHFVTRKTAITSAQAEGAESSQRMGQIEINAANAPRRTEAEIMKDLGF